MKDSIFVFSTEDPMAVRENACMAKYNTEIGLSRKDDGLVSS